MVGVGIVLVAGQDEDMGAEERCFSSCTVEGECWSILGLVFVHLDLVLRISGFSGFILDTHLMIHH